MDRIIVESCQITDTVINVRYKVEGDLQRYLKEGLFRFTTEYSESVANVPYSIAVIPFVANVLPLVWLAGGELIIEELDKSFYNSINEFKHGYTNMYPMLDFKGKVTANRIISNDIEKTNNTAAFFSGGVDAFATLLAHIEEKPLLLTLWGADVKLNDTGGWENVKQRIEHTANTFCLENIFIRTNFREIFNDKQLSGLIKHSGDSWWHGFQHGIGIISHAAPLVYTRHLAKVYIASSFTIREKGLVTCASDPSIDNHVKFCGSQVVHDQYEYARQDKIRHICEFVRERGVSIYLHVCWISSGGKNCCHCEKCYRTMLALFAEGEDPIDYGFCYTTDDLKKSYRRLKYQMSFRFKVIQQRFMSNNNALSNQYIKWIYTCDIEKMSRMTITKKLHILSRRICARLKLLIKM